MQVPLQLISLDNNGFHLWVEVVVFGQSFMAVIDTGASSTVFDKTIISTLLLHEHLLVASEHVSAGLGTVSMESFTVTVPDFKIGTLELPDFQVAVIDLSTINEAYANGGLGPVIGVVGGDILVAHSALIDYGSCRLVFPD